MSNNIVEENPAQQSNTPSGPQGQGAGGGQDKIRKQARQLAYDVRYKVKQSFKDGQKTDPASLKRAFVTQLGKSPAPGPVKLLAKKMLIGEEYDFTDISETVENVVSNTVKKIFAKTIVIDDLDGNPAFEVTDLVSEDKIGERKYKIRVTDKKTGKSYVRMADRAKISELRSNPNISSVEMTGYGTPYEGERKKGSSTAAVKSGKGLAKKDYDGDGKLESPTAEYKGSKDKAIKKALAKEGFQLDESDIADIIARLEKKRISKGGDPKDSPLPAMKKYHAKKKKVKKGDWIGPPPKKEEVENLEGEQIDEIVGQVVGGTLGATLGAKKLATMGVKGALAQKVAGSAIGAAAGEVLDPFKKNKNKNPVAAGVGGAAGAAAHGVIQKAIKSSYEPEGDLVDEKRELVTKKDLVTSLGGAVAGPAGAAIAGGATGGKGRRLKKAAGSAIGAALGSPAGPAGKALGSLVGGKLTDDHVPEGEQIEELDASVQSALDSLNLLDERLGGKGYSRKAAASSVYPGKKGTGDWEDSDRGAGNKAKRRAGGKVEKKSPTYRAYVLNKEHHQVDANGKVIEHGDGTPSSVEEAKVEAGRSDYGKASVRNKRKFGKEGEPAVFDASGERGKMIDQRRAEHKAKRGVKEDYYSGTGEKVQARTKKWMDKKGQEGAPGLDAMKARTAEHKAKRGVKEDFIGEVKDVESTDTNGKKIDVMKGKNKITINPNQSEQFNSIKDKIRSILDERSGKNTSKMVEDAEYGYDKEGKSLNPKDKDPKTGETDDKPLGSVEFDGGAVIKPIGDSREMPTAFNLIRNKLRARGIKL